MKPLNLNQLLFHPKNFTTVSFFLEQKTSLDEFEKFFQDILVQLQLRGKTKVESLLRKNHQNIKKILTNWPERSHGFFFSEKIQGFVTLQTQVETYCMIGESFHVRPVLEELFINPDYLVVNVSFYDIKVYKGDFFHLEIVKHFDFEEHSFDMKARLFTPQNLGLVPYKSILALKSIAHEIMELSQYQSMPVIVTGLEDMKLIFMRYFSNNFGVISHIHEDFYEKTCSEILEKCKKFRYPILDLYSAHFKEKFKKLFKSKKMISDLSSIIEAIRNEKVIQLVLPTERKLFGTINFKTGDFEIYKKDSKKNESVDILNELAEEVMRRGGKLHFLAPHFFPQDAHVLAIIRG